MTMVPSQNLISTPKRQQQQQALQYHRRLLLLLQRGDLYGEINNCQEDQEEEENMSHEYCSTDSDVVNNNIGQTMADSTTDKNDNKISSVEAEAEAEGDDVEGSWLQLSIGGPAQKASPRPAARSSGGGGPSELALDLLPGGVFRGLDRSGIVNHNSNTTSLVYNYEQYYGGGSSSSQNYYRADQPLNWPAFSPFNSSSSSSSFFNVPRQFHLHPPPPPATAMLRVVSPPRRPHSGIWFALRASQNQTKQPFLPQISKSFLRIKDGRMTVRLVIKYLVNKLRLESESEIEITCRGQQLVPLMTLQQVRDNIWGPNLSLLQDSSTTDHLMLLLYARSG